MPRVTPAALPRGSVITADVTRALAEDLGNGDLTANLLPPGTLLEARVVCRESAVFCGRAWFQETFDQLDTGLELRWLVEDGDLLVPNQRICLIEGSARPLLSGERTALNFIQTLSGTATATRAFVRALGDCPARLLDTRKTLPGLRLAQKYAVRCGGGHNHRIGLFDAILLKENHIAAAGGITAAVTAARAHAADVLLEVEVESLAELEEACEAGAERALLDNFSLEDLRTAVASFGGRLELEASGDVTLETVRSVGETGVDFISTGAITKHLRAVDYSLRFED